MPFMCQNLVWYAVEGVAIVGIIRTTLDARDESLVVSHS